MSSAVRVGAVILCGACGAAAAVWLGLHTRPDARPAEVPSPPSVTDSGPPRAPSDAKAESAPVTAEEPVSSDDFTPLKAPPTIPVAVPWEPLAQPFVSAIAERSPSPMRGPTVLAAAPPVAQQVDPMNDESRKPLADIQREINQVLTTPPPPAEILPPSVDAPPARTSPPPPGPAAKPASPERRDKESPQFTSEGDNKLSLHLVDCNVREALQVLSRGTGIPIMPSDTVQGTITASLPNVDFETALGAILKTKGLVSRRDGRIIYVGTSEEFKKRDITSGNVGTRLYRPNYIRASELQKLITPLLTPQVGSITVTSPAQIGIPSDGTVAGGNDFASADAVLVRDYESVLAQIDQVYRQMDTRPMQVSIEAMILSVKLNDTMQMGVDFAALQNKATISVVSGTPIAALSDLTANNGLKVGFLDSSLNVFLNALETIGDTNVIATPRLLVLDKMRAEILIGSQLGYVSTTVTQTSTTQAVQFLEVGTQLRIRPFISSDGMIRMEVHPELSTGSVQTQNGFTLPDKDVTGVTTNIMARDGATAIIGGLIREDLGNTTSQIPLLGSLPGVGGLFRQKSESTQRSEIIVLITPRIVYEPELTHEGNLAATEFQHHQAVYAEKMSPFGKRHLGKKYIFLAQQAWAQGDRDRAVRLVNLAIHFDPQSRAAIELRSDIVSGIHGGDYSAEGPFIPPGEQHPLDGHEIAPWILNDLDPAAAPPEPQHPLQPGTPGKAVDITAPGGS